jgi:hypothetical protein
MPKNIQSPERSHLTVEEIIQIARSKPTIDSIQTASTLIKDTALDRSLLESFILYRQIEYIAWNEALQIRQRDKHEDPDRNEFMSMIDLATHISGIVESIRVGIESEDCLRIDL